MRTIFYIFILGLCLPLILNGQIRPLEIKPTVIVLDSLQDNHVQAVYYLTNKSKDTLNITLTVSFNWCMPSCPKKILPGKTDSIVFDCGVYGRPASAGQFRINEGNNQYVCQLHFSMTRKAFYTYGIYSNKTSKDSLVTESLSRSINNPIAIKFKSYDGNNHKYIETSNGSIEKWYYKKKWYQKNETLSLERCVIICPPNNPLGYLNLYIETYYYSNGKIAQIITGYDWPSTHYETTNCCQVLTYKQWDKKGNLIYEIKSPSL